MGPIQRLIFKCFARTNNLRVFVALTLLAILSFQAEVYSCLLNEGVGRVGPLLPGQQHVVKKEVRYVFWFEVTSYSGSGITTTLREDSLSRIGSIRMDGTIQRWSLFSNADTEFVEYMFSDMKVQSTFQSAQPLQDPTDFKIDSLRILASYTSAGALLRVAWDNEQSDLLRNTILIFLSQVQVTVPREIRPRWLVREEYLNGTWLASYRVGDSLRTTECPNAVNLLKTVRRSIRQRPNPSERVVTLSPLTVFGGGMTICYDFSARVLCSIEGNQRQDFQIAKKTFARTDLSLSMKLTDLRDGIPPQIGMSWQQAVHELRMLPFQKLSTRKALRAQASAVDSSIAEPISVLVQEIKQTESQGKTLLSPEMGRRLARSLRCDSAALRVLDSESYRSGGASLLTQYAVSVLCEMETNESQRVASNILERNSRSSSAMQRLLPLILGMKEPNENIVSTLVSLSSSDQEPIATQARLVLGAIARSLYPVSVARSESIVERLLGMLSPNDSFSKNSSTLLALGNSGSAKILPKLDPLLASGDPQIRSMAVRCMRWVSTPHSDTIIARALLNDPDALVRLEAAGTFAFRLYTEIGMNACKKSAKEDQNEDVRIKSLMSLWVFREDNDEVGDFVYDLARTGSSAKVRACAQQIVASYPEYFDVDQVK